MLKWAFLGCKEQGYLILTSLIAAGYTPSLIVCLKELPVIEHHRFQIIANSLQIPFYLNSDLALHQQCLAQLDIALVCRFSLLDEAMFSLPRLGCVNVHCSLLPQYRGVHPIQWALVNGETETGVTLHKIDAGIDTGEILLQEKLTITPQHTFMSLSEALNHLSVIMCLKLFEFITKTQELPRPILSQRSSSYAKRRTEADSKVIWDQPAKKIISLVKAMQHPMPTAFCLSNSGKKIDILQCNLMQSNISPPIPGFILKKLEQHDYLVACADGVVKITVNHPLEVGTQLGSVDNMLVSE